MQVHSGDAISGLSLSLFHSIISGLQLALPAHLVQESALGGSGSPRDSRSSLSLFRDVAYRWLTVMVLSQQKVQQRVSMHDSYPSSIIKQGTISARYSRAPHPAQSAAMMRAGGSTALALTRRVGSSSPRDWNASASANMSWSKISSPPANSATPGSRASTAHRWSTAAACGTWCVPSPITQCVRASVLTDGVRPGDDEGQDAVETVVIPLQRVP